MVVYTRDCLVFSPNDAIIDTLIQNLSKIFHLEDQGDIQDFLEIHITHSLEQKSISMMQPGLIELQSEIALSTTKSEYIALSMATHDLLPIHHLLEELTTHSLLPFPIPTSFQGS
jgi:hypothetical protein